MSARRRAHEYAGRVFSIFKCGTVGVYQHVDAKHFGQGFELNPIRINARASQGLMTCGVAALAVKDAVGKRLT